ncbi:cystein proteinase inhibitor protein salarin-like isoform X3 [Erythrolamprus reginae]|uniref:cystein proteinase inhibitor protein salarin-like isoform X3 n=1 Tax=Erythrolamprus reginae TaxID=121349 RepID=UPI00396C8676
MLSSWVMLITWLVSLKEFSIAQDSASDDAWTDWKRIYGRVYTDEEASRRATWENTLQIVEQHNREADEGKHTYWMKMNHFSDWTNEELSHMLLLPERADPDNASQGFVQGPEIQPTPKPKKCHHRSHGTSRKDQLALAHRRRRSKHRSGKLEKFCLRSSNGTKKVLGRRCGCISRYRRRCQKCCKLAW